MKIVGTSAWSGELGWITSTIPANGSFSVVLDCGLCLAFFGSELEGA